MRAKLVKTHKGRIAATIERSFTDAPSLYQFLTEQNFHIEFRDVVHDISMGEVTYTVPLTNVEVDSEFQ